MPSDIASLTNETPVVCPSQEDSVTLCIYCEIKPAKKKFCRDACRQAAYRLSPAHRKNLDRHKARRLDRRNRWVNAIIRDKSFTFDGRWGGHGNRNVASLGDFEKYPAEHYLTQAMLRLLESRTAA